MNAGVYVMPAALAASGRDSSVSSLVLRAQEGDEEAFAALFEIHKRRVYSLCLFMTSDAALAEDLTQEVFIQVFRKIGGFRNEAAFSTWLHRIAVNTVLMDRRKRKPKQVSLDEPVCLEASVVQRDLACQDFELKGVPEQVALMEALKQLPKGCRTIFILHEVEGFEHAEIAQLLGCSAGNSKSQLHKARLKLRELLFPAGKKKLAA